MKPASTAPPPASRAKDTVSSNIGRVAKISTDGKSSFALVSVDEASAAERERLESANDDVGLSLLIATQRVFLVPKGTPVRILEVHEAGSQCLVRILDGEHYGKTAHIPLQSLTDLR